MNSLSSAVITVVTDYLGPAAEKFVNRQVTHHVGRGVTLETLSAESLPELFKWIEISSKLLIDQEKVAEMMNRLKLVR